MNKILWIILICLLVLTILSSCMQRAPVPWFGFGIPFFKIVSAKEKAFYNAVNFGTVEEMESFLQAGHDPNFMNGDGAIPWIDNNPLYTVSHKYEKSEVLIRYGADVRNRPYLFKILYNNSPIISEKYPDKELLKWPGRNEMDVYNLVKLFLDVGADPNFKGLHGMTMPPTDEANRVYFEREGYLPINSPIKYNAFTIVDLLINNGAIIDETSLKAAKEATERIGNDDMEKYIQGIWERQQEK